MNCFGKWWFPLLQLRVDGMEISFGGVQPCGYGTLFSKIWFGCFEKGGNRIWGQEMRKTVL